MARNVTLSTVDALSKTCRDSEDRYKHAASYVKRPHLRAFLLVLSAGRAHFAAEFESERSKIGKRQMKQSGSVAVAGHRGWIDIRAFSAGGDNMVLAAVEHSEAAAKETYERALNSLPTSNLAAIVQRQAWRIRNSHDKVRRNLRYRPAA